MRGLRPKVASLLAAGIGLLSTGVFFESARASEDPVLRDWTLYPAPHGIPQTPRPADYEFLKILPPLRPVPALDPAHVEAGMAPWWRDCSVHVFSEQPPGVRARAADYILALKKASS